MGSLGRAIILCVLWHNFCVTTEGTHGLEIFFGFLAIGLSFLEDMSKD